MKKRLLASLLAVVMVFASLLTPMGSDISVLAAETALVTSGTCGENSTWFFDSETGVLYLEGSGSVEQGNWYNYEDKIQMIVIGEDISEIDNESIERKSSGNYSNFMNIEVDSNNPYFSTIDGVLFNKSGSVLIWYPKNRSGSYNITEGVMRIEEYAFYNCREITTVTIPSSVSTIASDAFYSCVELSQVNFTEGLEVIENRAFQGCVRLKEIIIPSTVTNIGERAFAKCAASKYGVVGLEKVQILGTNTTLEGSVFLNVLD